jgi:hypothetical protein
MGYCNSTDPTFSTYLVGNLGVVLHDLLYSLSSRVFAFRGNRTMYPGVQGHVQFIPTANCPLGVGMDIYK